MTWTGRWLRKSGKTSVFAACVLTSVTASAAPPEPAKPEPKLTPTRRAVAVTTAIVPGILARGTGHFVAKQPKTGRTLLAVGGAGLGVSAASLVGIALTGASRRTTGVFATGMVFGLGAFALSFLADVYGVATPDSARGAPRVVPPRLQLESGLLYRYDRQFEGRVMMHQALDAHLGRRHHVRFELDALPGDPSLRGRGIYGYRVLQSRVDGSYLALEGGGLHQRFPNHGFFTTTVEAALRGRYDLERIGPSLRGAFVDGRAGVGFAALASRAGDVDADQMLLLRWAMGMYLGQGRGEVELFYDHRRDTYAGGALLERGRGGYAGFVGARTHWFFTERLGLQADLQLGSALITGVSVLFREGAK